MRNKLYGLIRGLRLSVSIPAGILVHIGSRLDGIETNWLLAITISVICGLTMLTNDYLDRYHDRIKRKTFAWDNDKLVRKCLIVGWSLTATTIMFFLPHKEALITICVVCLLYSHARHICGLSILLTACISAGSVLLPSLGDSGQSSIELSGGILIAIFGRELIKDAEDRDHDINYKQTFFTNSPREDHASWLRMAGYCFLLVAFKTAVFTIDMSIPAQIVCLSGTACITLAGLLLLSTRHVPKKIRSKTVFDIGMFLFLASLCI